MSIRMLSVHERWLANHSEPQADSLATALSTKWKYCAERKARPGGRTTARRFGVVMKTLGVFAVPPASHRNGEAGAAPQPLRSESRCSFVLLERSAGRGAFRPDSAGNGRGPAPPLQQDSRYRPLSDGK